MQSFRWSGSLKTEISEIHRVDNLWESNSVFVDRIGNL